MSVMEHVINYLTEKQGCMVALQDVVEGAERPRKPVLRVLDMLTAEGWLEQVEQEMVGNRFGEFGPPRRNPTWRVVLDPADRPVVIPRKNTLRQRIWHLIRSKRIFVKNDLIISSGASARTVDEFVKMLEKGGFIRRSGLDGRKVVYMLTTTRVERPLPGECHEK